MSLKFLKMKLNIRMFNLPQSAKKFYGLLKIHKEDPIAHNICTSTSSSFHRRVDTLTHCLAAWLAKHLTPYVGTYPSAHVKSNVDFKNKLLQFALDNDISDFKLVILDVEALFTQVPLEAFLDYRERKIHANTFLLLFLVRNFATS